MAKSLWYHYGPQGETRQLTSSAGLIVDTYTYGAYGVPVNRGSTGTDPNPFRYGGQVGYYTGTNQGAYMNLIRCGTRWYNPEAVVRTTAGEFPGSATVLLRYSCHKEESRCVLSNGKLQ